MPLKYMDAPHLYFTRASSSVATHYEATLEMLFVNQLAKLGKMKITSQTTSNRKNENKI